MTIKQAYNRKPTINVDFLTEDAVFSLKYKEDESLSDNGTLINKGNLSSAILSLSADNDMNGDAGQFSINLVGSERFDRILSPNDITIIRINPGKPNNVQNDVIMVGMISEVKRVGEYGSASVVYQITGQSMAKALMQLKLGTIQEAASMISGNGWMMGMGGLQAASSYTEGEGDSDEGEGNSSGNTNAERVWTKLTSAGFTKYAAAGILGNMYAESSVEPDTTEYGGGGGYGLVQWTPKSKLVTYAKSVNRSEKDLDLQVEYLIKQLRGTTDIFPDTAAYKPLQAANSVSEATKIFLNLYERAGVANLSKRVKAAQGYYDKFKGKTGSNTSSGNRKEIPTPGSQGVTLWGNSASGVVGQLIKWFLLLHTKYSYQNSTKSIGDFVESDLSSWTEDEMLMDPSPIMSYQGSLRDLITESLAKPFNEFFEDYTKDGKTKFIMRKAPFEPDEWKRLKDGAVKVYSNEVIEESLGEANNEAYSIFLANMPSNIVISDQSKYLSQPMYFPSLVDKYGYSLLQVDNPYIFSYSQDGTGGGSSPSNTTGGNTQITKPETSSIKDADLKWTVTKDVTATNLDNFLDKNGPTSSLRGTGKYFIEAGKAIGLNPVILLAIACVESGWGNSPHGKVYNYFAVGVHDKSPASAYTFNSKSKRSGIIDGATWLKHNYYDAGQKTIHSLFVNNGVHEYSPGGEAEADSIASLVASYYSTYPNALAKAKIIMDKGQLTVVKEKPKTTIKGISNDDDKNRNLLKKYSVLLANWYGDNTSYISGELRVVGNPDYRVGKVLTRYDNGQTLNSTSDPIQIDYYIESVSHQWNINSGYTTTLGVTRGLVSSIDRFKHWNSWKDPLTASNQGKGGLQLFDGGLFGEIALSSNIGESAAKAESGTGSNGSDDKLKVPKNAGDDYPSKWRDAAPDTVPDDWRYWNRECVSFVASRLSRDGKKGFTGLGNAIEWANKSGLGLQKSPKVGDVAWFNELDAPGSLGHVAYVSSVSGDNVFLEEYNYGYGETRHKYHTRTIKKTQASGYLRFKNK